MGTAPAFASVTEAIDMARAARFPLNGDGRESEPATVYMDLFTGALYLDKGGEVERYAQAFGGIWDACLDEAASRDLIHHAAEELKK